MEENQQNKNEKNLDKKIRDAIKKREMENEALKKILKNLETKSPQKIANKK